MAKNPGETGARQAVFDTLDRLRAYTEFESVTVGTDGSVSVKYAGKPIASAVDARKKDVPPRQTAIDSLTQTAPTFAFGK